MNATPTSVVAGRRLGASISQTFYVSYALSYNGVSPNSFNANDTFGLVLSDLTTPSATVSTNVFNFGLRGGTADSFGIRTATSTAGSVTDPTLTAGTEYLLVAKLTYSGGLFTQGDLWINPGGPSETTPDATYGVPGGPYPGVAAINSVYFRQAANEVGDTYRFDNLVLATAWNDVVPVPEPVTGAVLLMGGMALWIARRRRT